MLIHISDRYFHDPLQDIVILYVCDIASLGLGLVLTYMSLNMRNNPTLECKNTQLKTCLGIYDGSVSNKLAGA
jgi:hypothetical protein